MKKFLYLLIILLVVVSLTGCLGSKNRKTAKVIISVSNNIPGNNEVAKLELVPDYEKRVLKLSYNVDDLNSEVKSEIASDGEVGEENFARFERMLKVVGEYKNPVYGSGEKPPYVGILKIVLENENGKIIGELNTDWIDEAEGLEDIRAFYLELSTLLTESEQV